MNTAQEFDDSDVYKLASVPRRAIAFLLDLGFLYGLYQFVLLASPVVRSVIQLFFDIYKLQFLISENLVMNGIYLATGYLTLFVMVIIPLSFFNHSFGKKLLKLKVRGRAKYTISVGEAIKRELVLKPLSVLIIAGLVTPFFSKSKSSIHDMMCDTLVIED